MNYYKLFLFLLLFVSTSEVNAQSVDTLETFHGLQFDRGEETQLIPMKERITVYTETEKYKGTLDSVNNGMVYIDSVGIVGENIELVKFLPSAKRKRRNAFLWSAPISFAASLGFAVLYFASGADWADYTSYALLFYTPVGVVIGTVSGKKKRFKMSKGWELTLLE